MSSMPERQLRDSPLKVLILDNSADILELLSTDLQCRGCVVSTASVSAIRHGETDGGRLIESTAPDVIVFDVALPYEANWRVATELQADPRVRVPFVLTTTNATAVRRLIGRDLIELVGKPYDLDSLYDVILRAAFPDLPQGAAPALESPEPKLTDDRRSGLDRRTTMRRQAGHAEPEFL
jgi:CheY-like chemotaxis protein